MPLLAAGVDTAVIALWLGHEHVATTQIYIHADLAIKEKALARTAPNTLNQAVTNPLTPSLRTSTACRLCRLRRAGSHHRGGGFGPPGRHNPEVGIRSRAARVASAPHRRNTRQGLPRRAGDEVTNWAGPRLDRQGGAGPRPAGPSRTAHVLRDLPPATSPGPTTSRTSADCTTTRRPAAPTDGMVRREKGRRCSWVWRRAVGAADV
jgi:hypothetical protein